MRRKICGSFICVALCLCSLTACNTKDVKHQVQNVVDLGNENVLMVKGGHPNAYPDISYEEAFSDYFGAPTWTYFKGTQNGPDDDGDGKPDYVRDDIDIVEFTGDCMYLDVKVKACIQFELDKENGTFQAVYLSFNEVPQSGIMLNSLIEAAFSADNVATSSDDSILLDDFTKFNLAGEYKSEETYPDSVLSISVYSSPDAIAIGNYRIEFTASGYSVEGEIYSSDNNFLEFIPNEASDQTEKIQIVNITEGNVRLACYDNDEIYGYYQMCKAYPKP